MTIIKKTTPLFNNMFKNISTKTVYRMQRIITLSSLTLAISVSSFANTIETPVGNTDPVKLIYGNAIYDYYLNNHIASANTLLTGFNEELGIEKSYHADILLGQIYSDLQLIAPAKDPFNSVIKRDIIKKTRYETSYHLADLAFQEGDYETVITTLTKKINSGNNTEFEDRRKILLTNTYLAQKKLSAAQELSKSLTPDSHAAAYARYNIGTTLINNDRLEEGLELLNEILNVPPVTSEVKALRERAALAVGFTHIKNEDCTSANNTLSQVPLDSIYNNESLLGLGFCLFNKGSFKAALVPLHELIQGPATSPSVHEGLLLTARNYEELNANNRALFGYRYAIDILEHERDKLEKAISMTKTNEWLKPLQQFTGVKNEFISIDESAFNDYYHLLFNSQEFNKALVNYSVLKNYLHMLRTWLDKLQVIEQTVAMQQRKLSQVMPSINPRINEAEIAVEKIQRRYKYLKELDINKSKKREQHANKAYVQSKKVQKLTAKIEGLPLEFQDAFNQRLERVRGVLRYKLNTRNKGSGRAMADKENTEELDLLIAQLDERLSSIKALTENSNRLLRASPKQEFTRIENELESLLDNTQVYLAHQEKALKSQAIELLFVAYQQIKNQLGKAYHSLGRLQGQESLSKKQANSK